MTNDLPTGSALPSVRARLIAFLAIVAAGLAAAFIGWTFAGIQCTGDCAVAKASGAIVGALVGSVGVGVVAVLALRAMNEWRRLGQASDAED